MTGKAAGHVPQESAEQPNPQNPDTLEVVPGWGHEKLEGWIPEFASEQEIRSALEKAFDYRGDITITRKDGTKIEDSDIAALAFTGRDTAAGKSWEAWVKKYAHKKAAGEKNIALQPEPLE